MGEYDVAGEGASLFAHYADPTPEEKEQRRQRHLENRTRRREYLNEVKDVPCTDCGGRFPPYVMDFDHVRGEKLYEISDMTFRSMDALLTEIAKCDIVCANCHRIRTHETGLDKSDGILYK